MPSRPEDAQEIAQAILAHSGALVNRLSDQAREDAVRFAHQALAEAEAHLRTMRQRLADFRRDNRIFDPKADAAGQMGLLNALQGQLAQALVDRDVMLSYADATDQRVVQVNRRIDAITERIEAERASLGIPGAAGSASALPDVLSNYEELQVDLEFANKAYVQTLAGLAAASAEARRQSRYLAPHIQPTLASSSLYPRRALLSRAHRPLPAARLGHRHDHLLQCPRQPLSRRPKPTVDDRVPPRLQALQHDARAQDGARRPDPDAGRRGQGGGARAQRRRQVDAARHGRRHGAAGHRRDPAAFLDLLAARIRRQLRTTT